MKQALGLRLFHPLASSGFGVVERDEDKKLSTPVWGGSATPSYNTDNHLPGLARFSFTCLRGVRRRGKKKTLSEEGFLQSKALTEEIHYHYSTALMVARQAPQQEAQLCLHQLSLFEISTYFKVPVFSLVKGIAEACQAPSSTNSE